MPDRPPFPFRWEVHLAAGLISLLLAGASQYTSERRLDGALATAEVKSWWEAGVTARSRPPWRSQFVLERSVLRGLTSLLLAWRSYRLEHRSRIN